MYKSEIRVKRIMYANNSPMQSGDYCIFAGEIIKHIEGEYPEVHPIYDTISLCGAAPVLKAGDEFTITYNNPNRNKYGVSYSIVSVFKEVNLKNKADVKNYLNFICGEKITKGLMELENPIKLIEERNDNELLKVSGIGEKTLQRIYAKYQEYKDTSYAHSKLQPLGLTPKQIESICETFCDPEMAVKVCTENTYSLLGKVDGLGFKRLDEIAAKCGIDRKSPLRIDGAIRHIMDVAGERGKSYLYASQLLNDVSSIIDVEHVLVMEQAKKMISKGLLSVSGDGTKIALPRYIELEMNIANEINRLMSAKSVIKVPDNWREQVKEIEKSQGWSYTDEQLKGIETVLNNNLVVVSGKAGSGKSSVTNAMSEILNRYDIGLCCLSAKAAQRLSEVTGKSASTIHRLLLQSDNSNIYQDIIIIDEASMVNGYLFYKLLSGIKSGAKVIILGDDGQLTAIGNCAVFSDLISSKKVPHVELTKIHRQAEMSAIITKSIAIRNQQQIYNKGFNGHVVLGQLQDLELFVLEDEELFEAIINKFKEDLEATNNILEVQVITPLKSRGMMCTHNLNIELQKIYNKKIGNSFKINKEVEIYVGDKVINTKNNYNVQSPDGEKMAVFNGSIGIVKAIDKNSAIINFTGLGDIVIEKENYEYLNLAYAISCHSSQGSQWKRVICAFDMSSYILLNVEILYTALTRAMEHCSLVITDKAMQHSLRTVEQKTKQTLLSSFLESAA